jgi:hypothetical protein
MKRCMHQKGIVCSVYGKLKECKECDGYLYEDYFDENEEEEEEENICKNIIGKKIKDIEMNIVDKSAEIEDRQKLLNKFNGLLECVKIFETMLRDIIDKEWVKDDKS